ncbi:MAG: hypothetical protein WDN27_06895 [Candidatus Saccharibacteria bacterium]
MQTERDGTKLAAGQAYEFSFDDSAFLLRADGPYGSDAIKFLRLVFAGNPPGVLVNIQGAEKTRGCHPTACHIHATAVYSLIQRSAHI